MNKKMESYRHILHRILRLFFADPTIFFCGVDTLIVSVIIVVADPEGELESSAADMVD